MEFDDGFDEGESSSFEHVLHELSSNNNRKDTKSMQVAAVALALQESCTTSPPSPSQMYSKCVTALEGSLVNSSTSNNDDNDDDDEDASHNRVPVLALLEVLNRTIPFTNPNVLAPTLPLTGRVLRGVVKLATHQAAEEGDAAAGGGRAAGTTHAANANNANAILRMSCRTAVEIVLKLQQLEDRAALASLPQQQFENELTKLIKVCLLGQFQDRRPKVRKAAFAGMTEILNNNSNNKNIRLNVATHRVVNKLVTDYVRSKLKHATSNKAANHTVDLIHLLAFVQQTIRSFNTASGSMSSTSKGSVGEDVVKVLLQILGSSDNAMEQSSNSADYIVGGGGGYAGKKRGPTQETVVLVTALLSVLIVLVDPDHDTLLDDKSNEDHNKKQHDALLLQQQQQQQQQQYLEFSSRVLASLIGNHGGKPFVRLPAPNTCDLDLLQECHLRYGQVMGAACRRLALAVSRSRTASEDHEVNTTTSITNDDENNDKSLKLLTKLLPLTLHAMRHLSNANNSSLQENKDNVGENDAALTAEWTRVVRACAPAVTGNAGCMKECLQACSSNSIISGSNSMGLGGITHAPVLSPLVALLELVVPVYSRSSDINNALSSSPKAVVVDWIQKPMVNLVNLHEDGKDGNASAATVAASVETAVGNLIQGIGLQQFWCHVSLTEDHQENLVGSKKKSKTPSGGISENRAWLLPVLKTSSANCASSVMELNFFQEEVLGLARKVDAVAAKDPRQKSRVLDLWSLFMSFCVHPSDISMSFPGLAQILVRAMGDVRYPQLVSLISQGLKTLATGASQRADEVGVEDDTKENAQNDLHMLSNISTKLLPALFKTVETLHGTNKPKNNNDMETEEKTTALSSEDAQRVQSVTEAIAALARLAPPQYLQSLFKKVVQRLLVATQETGTTEKVCTLLGLAQALVASGSLDEQSIDLLYRSIKPLIRTDENESRVQKRAYKVMAEICERYTSFVTSANRLQEMIDLLVGSIMTCQVSARHMRLKCLAFVVGGFDSSNQEHMNVLPKIMGEVLLCLKDANGKTREAAYQLLLAMYNAQNDATAFFQTIVAALGAKTPHMRSAAVMALSRLAFEYARNDLEVQSLLPSLLQTTIVLFDESSREVIKSVVGFVRVCVAAMTAEQLEPILPEVVGGLMKFNKGKDRFRSKIKIILKKLVRVYGYEKLMPLVPDGDTRLLNHMKKLAERDARRKAENREQRQEHNKRSNDGNYDQLMESDEDDSDDGRTLMTGITGFTKMTGKSGGRSMATAKSDKKSVRSMAQSTVMTDRSSKKGAEGSGKGALPRIRAEKDGEVMDMLDASMAKSVRFASTNHDEDDSDDDASGVMEFDDHGRLVVPDDLADQTSAASPGADDDERDAENDEIKFSKKRRVSKFESAKVAREEEKSKRASRKKQAPKSLGAAYKSKSAGGDVKKKGQKYEPYAFVPLDGKKYTKKHRKDTVAQMSTVVREKGRKRRR